jgi:hypothetical protein
MVAIEQCRSAAMGGHVRPPPRRCKRSLPIHVIFARCSDYGGSHEHGVVTREMMFGVL